MPQGITSLRLAATSLLKYLQACERNVKYASQVKRTSCVKCAFGTICGTLNFTAPKEQLHYAAGHNFTAACRNFTFYIQDYVLIY